jgi:hypothetical protein
VEKEEVPEIAAARAGAGVGAEDDLQVRRAQRLS